MGSKYITFMIVPDDEAEPKRYRVPVWLYRTFLVLAILVIIAPVAYIATYYELIGRAADAGRLTEENESLRKYQYKVQILEQSLLDTRQLMAEIAGMAGLDSVLLADLYGEGDSFLETHTGTRPGSLSRTLPASSPIPDGLPATGWITRGFSEIPGKVHLGVDLAMAIGTPVYSTAYGVVTYAGTDKEYGYMMVVKNNDTIETVYGHNSQLTVRVGDTILAGQQIALSGNTGNSSAPHLHYEIRVNGEAVNPIKYFIYEN
ncbi:MAG: M23 family metallopeptidase [candidate division Zixibacteria bacterium]|nr:M23 family metallopeptidase [candidate division Zixibacteria bacterium]